MEILAMIGVVVLIVGGLGALIAAFTTSIWWGLGCLLISPVYLLFLVLHWKEAKNSFFLQLAGIGIILLAGSLQ
jgi:hypothetical protein